MPQGQAGRHGYTFEQPENTPQHKAQDYIPRAAAGKSTSGNMFHKMAHRNGWEGALEPMWRLSHDPVRNILTSRKPFVVTTKELRLEKGKPMKVCWLNGTALATAPVPVPLAV